MATFRVTASELKAKAEELQQMNTQFRNEVSEMENMESALSGMWEYQARDTFHNAFNSDKIQMSNFANAIDTYVMRLEAAAAKYEQIESTNVEIANARNYR